jgi:hypothetical protein
MPLSRPEGAESIVLIECLSPSPGFPGELGVQNIDTFFKQPEFDDSATRSQLLPLSTAKKFRGEKQRIE